MRIGRVIPKVELARFARSTRTQIRHLSRPPGSMFAGASGQVLGKPREIGIFTCIGPRPTVSPCNCLRCH